jgi:sensor histidine kinase YesM
MRCFLFFYLSFLHIGAFSQVDTQVQNAANVIDKAIQLSKVDIDSSVFYLNQAKAEAKALANDSLIVKCYLQESRMLVEKGHFEQADTVLHQALKLNVPGHIVGRIWKNLGVVQYYKNQFQKALDLYLKAADIFQNTKHLKLLVDTYCDIGNINAVLKNYEKATQYLEKALAIHNTNDIVQLRIVYNLAVLYYDLKRYSKFIATTHVAKTLAEQHNSKRILSGIYTNLSNYYTDIKPDALLAIDCGKKSLQLKKQLHLVQALPYSYNNVGYSYLNQKSYKKAIQYLDSALQQATPASKVIIFNNLKDAYAGVNNLKKALFYAEAKDRLKDSITEAAQKEKVVALIEQYESEKKQHEIEVLHTKNTLQALKISQQYYWLGAVLVLSMLVLAIGYFSFRSFKTKQQLDKIILQQQLLKSQLNPHFLFNALQSIQNFIHKNDKEKSSAYLTNYAKLIRLVLENSDQNTVTVHDDKLALIAYLELQQLTHNNSFNYEVTVADAVVEDFDSLPPLITQPFVENAVLHGVKTVVNGKIHVAYYKENNALCVAIVDNGKGFVSHKHEEQRLHKSMSMQIIKKQFEILQKTSKTFKGSMEIDQSNGTKVLLKFTNS